MHYELLLRNNSDSPTFKKTKVTLRRQKPAAGVRPEPAESESDALVTVSLNKISFLLGS